MKFVLSCFFILLAVCSLLKKEHNTVNKIKNEIDTEIMLKKDSVEIRTLIKDVCKKYRFSDTDYILKYYYKKS